MTHSLIQYLEGRLQEAEKGLQQEKLQGRQYSQIHTEGYISALKVAISDAKRLL